jgi:2-polyprenyl-6-hydroxyphenyl methylase/3-demethylubiquinone-9 3-methyltransferase
MCTNQQKLKSQGKTLGYWQKVLKNSPPLFKIWFKKENSYLRKIITKGSVVLDVGCGSGKNIKEIANVAERVVGIDNDELFFKENKKILLEFKNVEVFLEDAQRMHFKNNTFDYTICMGATFGNFGLNKTKILREMKRVTKKGGKIIVSVYSEKALPVRLKVYQKIGFLVNKVSRDGTVVGENGVISEQFSKEKLSNIFNKSGLNAKIIKLGFIAYLCEASK